MLRLAVTLVILIPATFLWPASSLLGTFVRAFVAFFVGHLVERWVYPERKPAPQRFAAPILIVIAFAIVGVWLAHRRSGDDAERIRAAEQREAERIASLGSAPPSVSASPPPAPPPSAKGELHFPARVRSAEGYPAKKGDACELVATANPNVSAVSVVCGALRFDATVDNAPIEELPGDAPRTYRYDLNIADAKTKSGEGIVVESWALRAFVRGDSKHVLLLDMDAVSLPVAGPPLVAEHENATPTMPKLLSWKGHIASESKKFRKDEPCEAHVYPTYVPQKARITIGCESGAMLEPAETLGMCVVLPSGEVVGIVAREVTFTFEWKTILAKGARVVFD